MQSLINTFLRPHPINSIHPPIITIAGTTVVRKDHLFPPFTISLYSSKKQQAKGVVLYCHSFGSNKHQAEAILPFIIKNGMKLVTFNFMRSNTQGKIDNENGIVTFGYRESEQIQVVLEWIQAQKLGPVILWGRSMGAVAALRSQILKPAVSGIILDSPYQSLKQAVKFMISQHTSIPGFLVDSAYLLFRPSIQQSLGFNIQNLNVGDLLETSQPLEIPCLFISSKNDTCFGEATENLYRKYSGIKQLVFTENTHSSPREERVLQTSLKNILNMAKVNQKRIAKKSVTNSLRSRHEQEELQRSLQLLQKIPKPIQTIKLENVGLKKKFQLIKEPKIIPNCFGFCSSVV